MSEVHMKNTLKYCSTSNLTTKNGNPQSSGHERVLLGVDPGQSAECCFKGHSW